MMEVSNAGVTMNKEAPPESGGEYPRALHGGDKSPVKDPSSSSRFFRVSTLIPGFEILS